MAQKTMYCGMNSMTNPTLTLMTCKMTHEQIQQTFSEESDDDEFWGSESILLILVRLICGFVFKGGLLFIKTGASYTRVYTICTHRNPYQVRSQMFGLSHPHDRTCPSTPPNYY